METEPARLAESLGLKSVSPDITVIPAQARRLVFAPLFFATTTIVGAVLVLYPANFPNYLFVVPPVVGGWACLAFSVPVLVMAIMNLVQGGPQLTVTPSGFAIRRQLFKRSYRWKDVGPFAVEVRKLFGFIRIRRISFVDRAPEKRSLLRRFFGRENFLVNPVGNNYSYSLSPESLAGLLNAFVARYGAP